MFEVNDVRLCEFQNRPKNCVLHSFRTDSSNHLALEQARCHGVSGRELYLRIGLNFEEVLLAEVSRLIQQRKIRDLRITHCFGHTVIELAAVD
jgi:hypothetical protein